jgi:hypothetical protein
LKHGATALSPETEILTRVAPDAVKTCKKADANDNAGGSIAILLSQKSEFKIDALLPGAWQTFLAR